MQLIGAAMPDVPNHALMPQASKQLLNACPIPPMHVIVRLLAGYQSAILSSNEWHNDHSITTYGVLGRLDIQIVALCANCA